MPLFQKSVEKKYLNEIDSPLLKSKYDKFQNYFGNLEIQENIRNLKEEEFQEGFLSKLFVDILGYTLNPEPDFNLKTEFKNISNSKKADGAILKGEDALAVIELKGTDTPDLDKIESQAFGYKNHHPKCVYVITSNFEKLRFYIQNAVDHIDFDLFNLTKEQFLLMWLCLAKDNLINNLPLKIKESSVLQEENITKKLYSDYSKFREAIYHNLIKNNPDTDKLLLFKKTQKLLDRFLFIFFAEDRLLLPANSISKIVTQWEDLKNKYDEYFPLYDRFKKHFGYINTGFKDEIFGYNGGLFLPDDILDNITIDDDILLEHTVKLSKYDFETDVDVNILGHIFEHSLGEIEIVQAEIKGEKIDAQKSKRKKDGIYYTPKYITKYIVENTVGKLCQEKRQELDIVDEEYAKDRKSRKKDTIKALDDKLTVYRNWLLSLTILDPACGSGAFLNQALEFLITEHSKIDKLRAQLLGEGLVFPDITTDILEKNIYGVDINEESVEIAKLSLWLRTARKGRKLNTLSNNIKCGNSLIDDPEVAGDKAFKWEEEFPNIFTPRELKAFHVTWETYNSRDKSMDNYGSSVLLSGEEREQTAKFIDEKIRKENYRVIQCNVLTDHVHSIIVCEESELSKIVGQLKGYSSYQLHNSPRLDMTPEVNPGVYPRGTVTRSSNADMTPEVNPGERGTTVAAASPVDKSVSVDMPPEVNPGVYPRGTGSTDPDAPSADTGTPPVNPGVYPRGTVSKAPRGTAGKTPRGTADSLGTGAHTLEPQYSDGTRQKLWSRGFSHTFIGDDNHLANTIEYIRNNHRKHKCSGLNYKFTALTQAEHAFRKEYKGGFDVIIGNPPYGAKLSKNMQKYLNNKYIRNASETVISFLKLSENVLNEKGFLGFIMPKAFCYATNYEPIRSFLRDNITEIVDCQKVWEEVKLEQIMLMFRKGVKIEHYYSSELKLNTVIKLGVVDKDNFDKFGFYLNGISNIELYLGLKIFDNTKLSEVSENYWGDVFYSDIETTKQQFEVLGGAEIQRYYRRGIKGYVADIKFSKNATIKPNSILIQRIIAHIENPFPHIKIASTILNNINIKIVNTVHQCIFDKKINNKYALTLMNSNLMNWYIYRFVFAKAIRSFQFSATIMDKLPIPDIPLAQQQPFIDKADIMLEKNKELHEKKDEFIGWFESEYEIEKLSNKLKDFHDLSFNDFLKELKKKVPKENRAISPAKRKELETYFTDYKEQALAIKQVIDATDREIDRMVYELYGLTEEEIKIVEGVD